jgi:GTPase SAR1 family protein
LGWIYDYDAASIGTCKDLFIRFFNLQAVASAVRNQATVRIHAALNIGEKAWNRSKIMLVGEGRAGKTALAKSFMGLPFAHTDSTCGMEQFQVEVTTAEVASTWRAANAPESELDAAVVAMTKDIPAEVQALKPVPSDRRTEALGTGADHSRLADPCERDLESVRESLSGNRASAVQVSAADVLLDSDDHTLSQRCPLSPQEVERIHLTLLSGSVYRGSDLMVQLFDFAGQDVFTCLHPYFLTRHGVYVIVFNMNWLAIASKHLVEALENISFWLNSVAMNTRMECSEEPKVRMAPVFLVGSHKDQVFSAEEHVRISDLLKQTFSYSTVWQFIVENSESGLVFFPVNSKLGSGDATLVQLRAEIERSIRCGDYISVKRPLQWFKALDALQELTCPVVPLSRATDIAVHCGVRPQCVNEMLEFFRDMGMIMWYNEPGLRDTVILDPVAYFVKSVTRVICQFDLHNKEAHQHCQKRRCKDFDNLFATGVGSPEILQDLLQYDGHDTDTLLLMMMKYGLAVAWRADTTERSSSVKYFIPALFPVTAASTSAEKLLEGKAVRTIHLFFALNTELNNNVLREVDLPMAGFLPKGLFEKLLCTTLGWCYETHGDVSRFRLCRSSAILQAAKIWFRVSWISTNHCIRIDAVVGENGPSVEAFVNELCRRWRAVTTGGLQVLAMEPLVAYMGQRNHHLLLVPFTQALGSCSGLPGGTGVNDYHLFLSYRWGKLDKEFVTILYQHLAGAMVRGQSIRIFLDDKVLNSADRFQKIFFDSILVTEVFVPTVTTNALQRMVRHDPREVDNLLVEWLTALLLMKFPDADSNGGRFPLRFIFPICLNDRKGRGYFSLKDTLSRVVPVKTIAALKDLLMSKGIICSARVSQFLETVTVKDIVVGVMESICIDKKEDEGVQSMVSDCGEGIMELFLRTDGIKVPDPSYLSRREELVIAEPEKGGICTIS